jgi:outer membrane protein OmpA-like peptidoglycan-associated protein
VQGKVVRSGTSPDGSGAPGPESGGVGKHTRVEQINGFGLSVGATPADESGTPVQRKANGAAASDAAPADLARHGTSGGGGSLPYLDQIQTSFGHHDVSGVKAHHDAASGEASRALGAQAFAFGNSVAFGVGFGATPDLHTAAHEAAHVVQQRAGVQLKGGIDGPNDPYERHADAVADAVVGGRSAASLLDQMPGQGAAGGAAVQRKKVNTTTTPDVLPDAPPPDSIAPLDSEPHVDAEGNKIVEHGGHWHLTEAPKSLKFPIAGGYKYQLLPINPNAAYTALHARVKAIQAEQLAYATTLAGDMKYWFAKVYYFVTTHELASIDAGLYLYPHMKMQEVVQFHAAYKVNLDNWRAGNKDKVEAHWKKAFGAAEGEQGGTWYKPRSMELMNALLPSMQAHIRFDLPRALATCFVDHYAGIPGTGIGDFKPDFDAMGPVFDKAQVSLLAEIKDDTWAIDPGRFGPVQDAGFPFIFNVTTEREHTFEKASRLAKGMRNGETNAEFLKAMRANTKVMHPNSGADDFSVDGTDVGSKFDWMNQPGAKPDQAAPAPTHEAAPAPPTFPEKLFFKQGRGQGDDKLEQAIRDDQDLAPYKALAEWTRKVRGAELYLEGHASAEGEDYDNANLAGSRAFLVKYFMWMCGADADNNKFSDVGMGEAGSTPKPEWRFVLVKVNKRGTGRQQHNTPNPNLPSEVAK